MPMAEKAVKKETVHKCLWQRKKEQTTNAGGKWKMAALIMKSKQLTPNERNKSKQLTPNERNKTAETTSKPQTATYLQA